MKLRFKQPWLCYARGDVTENIGRGQGELLCHRNIAEEVKPPARTDAQLPPSRKAKRRKVTA